MFIDFNTSYICWKTHCESYGKFKVESFLNHNNENWLLGSVVMACDVYGKTNLIHQPSYLFQPLFSEKQCVIFRTYTDSEKTDNTINKGSDLFKTHSVKINYLTTEKHKKLELSIDINSNYQAKIITQNYQLQFPIKHINYKPTTQQMQVETGIIAVPYAGTLSLAYIAFNHLNAFELILINGNKTLPNIIKETNCEINIIKI